MTHGEGDFVTVQDFLGEDVEELKQRWNECRFDTKRADHIFDGSLPLRDLECECGEGETQLDDDAPWAGGVRTQGSDQRIAQRQQQRRIQLVEIVDDLYALRQTNTLCGPIGTGTCLCAECLRGEHTRYFRLRGICQQCITHGPSICLECKPSQ